MFAAGHAIGGFTLAHHAEIMRRAGGLQFDAAFQRLIVEPVQHPLVLFGSNHLLGGDIDAAAHRHQQEGVQRVGAQRARQVEHVGQLMRVVPRDGGVDLHRDAELPAGCACRRRRRRTRPGMPRKVSCVAASEPSSEIETRLMPAFLIFSATSLVTRVPLVASAVRRPRLVAYSASWKMS